MDHFGKAPTKFGPCAGNCAQYLAIALFIHGLAALLSFLDIFREIANAQGLITSPIETIELITGAYALYVEFHLAHTCLPASKCCKRCPAKMTHDYDL